MWIFSLAVFLILYFANSHICLSYDDTYCELILKGPRARKFSWCVSFKRSFEASISFIKSISGPARNIFESILVVNWGNSSNFTYSDKNAEQEARKERKNHQTQWLFVEEIKSHMERPFWPIKMSRWSNKWTEFTKKVLKSCSNAAIRHELNIW